MISEGAGVAGDAPDDADSSPRAASLEADKPKNKKGRRHKLASKMDEAVGILTALEKRLARVERVQREMLEGLSRLHKDLRSVEASMATKGDAKKLKKMLDLLEVVEIAEDAPALRAESKE